MKYRCCCLSLILCLLSVSCHRQDAPVEAKEERLILPSASGEALSVTLYRSRTDLSPALLLLPGKYRSAAVWEGFARRLQHEGFTLLVLDDRDLTGQPLEELYRRLDAAKDRLVESGAHPLNLAVAGESTAAGLALLYAAHCPDMQAAVLLSPPLVYLDQNLESVMAVLKDCPSLIAAAEGDRYGAQAATVLKKSAPVFAELRLWPGSAHGTDLFAGHPEAVMQIVQWLKTVLNAS